MPELERELEDDEKVREDERPSARHLPARVAARGHKRPKKRASGASVVIVLALVVSVAVVGWRLYQARSDDASPGASEQALSSAEAKLDQLVQRMPYAPGSAFFTSRTNGYATVLKCAKFSEPNTCAEELALTKDGGAHWTRQKLPAQISKGLTVAGARMYPVGNGGLVLDVPGSLPPEAIPDISATPSARPDISKWVAGQRWYTGDRGRTWQRRSRVPAQTVTEVPPGGRLILPVPDPVRGADGRPMFYTRAHVLLPDGSARLLANGPTGQGFTDAPVTVAADGRIWIPGFAMNPTSRAITVRLVTSVDRGRTFTSVPMPKVTAPPAVFTGDGRTVHLVQYDGKGMRLQRTTNNGASWQDIKLPAPAKQAHGPNTRAMVELVASATAGPGGLSTAPMRDGSLLVSNGAELFRLAPGAKSFAKMTGVPTVFSLIPAGPVTIAFGLTSLGAPTFFTTADGKNWVPFALT